VKKGDFIMLFDSHAHINNETYNQNEREKLIRDIENSDVSYVMDVGFDLESSLLAYNHAQKYDWCYAIVGCHPHEAEKMSEEDLILFKGLAKKPKVQAIGEIGLDYYRNLSDPEIQRYWFRRQIQLALELSMPIVIHDRDANNDVMQILKEEGVFSKARTDQFPRHADGLPDARLLMHCYSGSREMAEQYLKLGATISIAGPVTYKNARKLVEVVEAIPIEHLLIETDAPYLTPEPLRGRPNQSPYVEHTARKIAEIKGLSYEEAARITCENAKRFFNIE
jgi:TatD DNase family protein